LFISLPLFKLRRELTQIGAEQGVSRHGKSVPGPQDCQLIDSREPFAEPADFYSDRKLATEKPFYL
jgi:hypothetical protein